MGQVCANLNAPLTAHNVLGKQAAATHPLQLSPCVLRRPRERLACSGSWPRQSTDGGNKSRTSQLSDSAPQQAGSMYPGDLYDQSIRPSYGSKRDTQTTVGVLLPKLICLARFLYEEQAHVLHLSCGPSADSAASIALNCVELCSLAVPMLNEACTQKDWNALRYRDGMVSVGMSALHACDY